MEHIARAFEWAGIAVIVGASLVTLWVTATTYRAGGYAAFEAGRRTFGRGLLAGLEVFVAADLIRTVSVDLTLEAVGALGLLVVIRTILSFSIDVEINGVLPWRIGPDARKLAARVAGSSPAGDGRRESQP
jgi:uncharacterized membrane protein